MRLPSDIIYTKAGADQAERLRLYGGSAGGGKTWALRLAVEPVSREALARAYPHPAPQRAGLLVERVQP